ncbi:transmembrane protein 218 isoform 1-T1 [Morphnus guianensis]
MAGAALGAGPGVLVLQLLWGLALLLCLALSRAAGRARFAVVLVTLGAAVLSAALLLFPREDERPATAAADELSPELQQLLLPLCHPLLQLGPRLSMLPPAFIFQHTLEHADSPVAGSFDNFPL